MSSACLYLMNSYTEIRLCLETIKIYSFYFVTSTQVYLKHLDQRL